ncbi:MULTISPECIES: septal ring lytic transglycosylase RlpA family protein [unclassified Meiothermus]|uniref:septal ring lytic transglycosylase RlpA family protein n=1 Tax=unclassified Meiothermus TaxID=370471 RepID=UPI000D7D11CB|nr:MULTISPECIES: septal ring lytic transglycosylase RlpA family protein [unclassified Meiothermus]PZA06941.1 septal ring lytic transglycosylase RlpA family lipoprotein [Meiothermus sp. Pnk-1]RYM38329.1 septal ring lytic transglycosylase RlpA family protein [Meiothermus sp. PNK-Is4]
MRAGYRGWVLALLLGSLALAQTHTVQKGDTLYSIARRYGTSVQALQQANNLSGEVIKVGQVLAVAGSSAREATASATFTGLAAWYGSKFHGRTTASGEPYDMYALTAAHRSLPFGTQVRVTNPRTGRSVVVRINDRGPFTPGFIIDLSYAAAQRIGLRGRQRVSVEVLR